MKNLNERWEYYIWKAKHQRGLTDEQIAYFQERCNIPEMLPYYATGVKHKLSNEEALEWVRKLVGTLQKGNIDGEETI